MLEIYTVVSHNMPQNIATWGIIIVENNEIVDERTGYMKGNINRGEIMSAVEALESIKEPSFIDYYTNSERVVNCFIEGWLEKWNSNGWHNNKGGAIKNQDLYRRLRYAAKKHDIRWKKLDKKDLFLKYPKKAGELARNVWRDSIEKN